MSDVNDAPGEPDDLTEATMPFLTLLGSLLMLLFFGVAGLWIYGELDQVRKDSTVAPPEEALRLMRENQEARLSSTGYDPATKSSFIPITTAMDRIAQEKGKAK